VLSSDDVSVLNGFVELTVAALLWLLLLSYQGNSNCHMKLLLRMKVCISNCIKRVTIGQLWLQ